MSKSKVLPLHDAVLQNNITEIKKLLKSGVNLEAVDSDGRTALLLAARYATISIVEMLLAYLDPNACNSDGGLLHIAVETENDELFELLLKQDNINFDVIDSHGNTPLRCAAENQNIPMARVLLERGADPNICGEFGGPLHSAISLNNWQFAKLFLDADANINAKNHDNITPLDMVAEPSSNIPQKLFFKYCLNIGTHPNSMQESLFITRETELNDIVTLLEKFKQLYLLTTAEVDINKKQLIPTAALHHPLGLQLPDDQDLEPENLPRFTERFIQNLFAETPDLPTWKKLETLNANLKLLLENDQYKFNHQWIGSLLEGITGYMQRDTNVALGLQIAAAKVIVKHVHPEQEHKLPLPPPLKDFIGKIRSDTLPQKRLPSIRAGSPGPSR